MNSVVLISVLVNLYNIIIIIKAEDSVQSTVTVVQDNQHIAVHEGNRLYIRIENNVDPETIDGPCTGSCKRQGLPDIELMNCVVESNEKQKKQLSALTRNGVKKEDNTLWTCVYQLQKTAFNEHDQPQTQNYTMNCTIDFEVIAMPVPDERKVYYYAIAGVLVLLVIIAQAACTVHFKRKAAAIKRQVEWSNRRESAEDTVRYDKMPSQKNRTVQQCKVDRESCIYEALDLQVPPPPVPEPPPLTTIPTSSSCLVTPLPPSTPRSITNSFTNGILLPFSSLTRKKTKKSDSGSANKSQVTSTQQTSSLERIKERPKMPLPSEEDVYEAVPEVTPPSTLRKDLKPKGKPQGTKEVQLPIREEFRGFKTQPRINPPSPAPKFGGGGDPVNSPVLPSHIKPGFRTQPRPNPQPPKHKFVSGADTMNNPVLPSQLKHALELRKQGNASVQELSARMAPFNQSFNSGMASPGPKSSGVPPPVPKPSGMPPPALRTMKPAPSPNNSLPRKWKPPPPSKPKQLHPLPPPPKPEPIHVTTVRPLDNDTTDDDDDEEWTYEPLDKYQLDNIYNV